MEPIKKIKLMTDYHSSPLWHMGGDDFGPIEPDELPLTQTTKERLLRWADWYDATLNEEYPPDSGFRSIGEVLAFESEGTRLWNLLKEELPAEYKVSYFSTLLRRVIVQEEENSMSPVTDAQRSLATGRK